MERRYDLLAAHSRDVVLFVRRADGRVLDANPAAVRLYGYTREELLKLSITDLRAPETRDLLPLQMAEADRVGTLFETLHRRRDGTLIPVEVGAHGVTIGGQRTLISVIRDITERREAERALREREADLHRAQAVAKTGSWRLDVRRDILRWSDETYRIFGIPLGTPLSYTSFLAVIHPDDREMVDTAWREALAARSGYEVEHRIVVGGQVKWIRERAELEFNAEGELLGGFGMAQDITQRKAIEETLRQREEQLRLVLSASQVGWWHWDLQSGTMTGDERAREFLGIEADQPPSLERFIEVLHPDDRELSQRQLATLLARPGEYQLEFRVVRPDGEIRWILARGRSYHDDAGRPLRAMGVVIDITDQKRTEERRALLAEVTARLLSADQPQAIVESLCRRVMVQLNCHAFFNYLVDEPSDRLRLNAYAGIPPETAQRIEWLDQGVAVCGCAARDGCRIVAEHIQTTADPRADLVRSFGIQAYACHPLTNEGRVIGTLSFGSRAKPVFSDDELLLMKTVAEQVALAMQRARLLESLACHARAADAANRAKSEFLANMSHEIRTPMTAILGFADLLLEPGNSPDESREYLGIIRENGRVLLQLINDILDLSRIEAERMAIEKAVCSPRGVVEEVISLLRVRAQAKQLQLRAEFVPHVPPVIFTDPIRLRQILVNLVGNAVKFTELGEVVVRVWCDRSETGATLHFAVTDTGIGIPADALPHIFRPFTQADMSHTRRFGGSGLGLTISQRLAERLGGAIAVASTPGAGSTFTLTIDPGPLDQLLPPPSSVTPQGPQRTPQVQLAGRVLLAEDVAASVRLVRAMLQRVGVEIEVAENGLAACQKCCESMAQGRPYDLVLMDIQMPEMDGLEASRRLRAAGWQGPIVALTANAMQGDREKCLAAGCDGYLSKPLDRDALLQAAVQYLERVP
jgi:PAS domain S-box-containing protein